MATFLPRTSSREGDRFTATVGLPTQYAGGRIEGRVTNVQRSGRITGRSELTLNFDSIRLRDGRSYKFAGLVQTVRTPNGDSANVDTMKEQSGKIARRTKQSNAPQSAQQWVPSLGPSPVAAKAPRLAPWLEPWLEPEVARGSVYIQGRDDLELPQGTEITIQVTGPNR